MPGPVSPLSYEPFQEPVPRNSESDSEKSPNSHRSIRAPSSISNAAPDQPSTVGSQATSKRLSNPLRPIGGPQPTALECGYKPYKKGKFYPNGQTWRALTYAEVAAAGAMGLMGPGAQHMLALQEVVATVAPFFGAGVWMHVAFTVKVWKTEEENFQAAVKNFTNQYAKLQRRLKTAKAGADLNTGEAAKAYSAEMAALQHEIAKLNLDIRKKSIQIETVRLRVCRDVIGHPVNNALGIARSAILFHSLDAFAHGHATQLSQHLSATAPHILTGTAGLASSALGIANAAMNIPIGMMEIADSWREGKLAREPVQHRKP